MLAKYSHLLPIQPSRASNLLPSLLGVTCSQTRWVTPTISTAVIDFFAYKPEFLQVLSISGDTANLMVMPFIRVVLVFNIFFNDHVPSEYIEKLNTTVSLNQHHIHLIYGSLCPLKWTEPQSCLVYRQILRSIIGGVTQRVCKPKQRRQKARCS